MIWISTLKGDIKRMSKLEDVYNGKIDLGNVDEAWLHDADPSLFHMFFGDKCCVDEDAELDYYHETDPNGFHDYFGYDYCRCGKDEYWGCGRKGNGKNRLGQILMQVREQLKNGTILQDSEVYS